MPDRVFCAAAIVGAALSACAGDLSFSVDLSPAEDGGPVADAARAHDQAAVEPAGVDLAGDDLAGVDLAVRDLSAVPADQALPPGDLASPRGTFVAVGYGGRRIFSGDSGQTWTNDVSDMASDNSDDLYVIRDVGWGNGAWITAGGFNGWTWTSSDGKTWTGKNAIDQWFGSVMAGKGIWVAVGGFGRRSMSGDGITWTDNYDSAGDAYRAGAFGDYMGGRWVGVGDSGRATVSSDGSAWTIATGVPAGDSLSAVAYGGGVFVAAAANSANFVRSTDGGATWTSGTLPGAFQDITYGAGKFVAIGSELVMTSSDGTTWSMKTVSNLSGTIAFGNGTFVALSGGTTFFSNDASSWTSKNNVPSGNDLVKIRFGGTP